MNYPIPKEARKAAGAIIGRTESGKTSTAKGLVATEMDEGVVPLIIDPTGVWWGIKSTAAGEPAYPVVVFGGKHADVPLRDGAGAAVATTIVRERIPSIIDVSEMPLSVKPVFMADFLEAIYLENREPLLLVVDEADLFAPQRSMPATKRVLDAMEQICRRGRVRGFRPWLITQRPADLHKSVLSQANTLIALQLTSPQDREAVGSWIEGQADREQGKKVLASLPKLVRGEGWIWAPHHDMLERVRFPKPDTFDSSSTPQDGTAVAMPKLAEVDIGALRDALAMVEDAAAADDPVALRASVKDLERQLREKGPGQSALQAEYARGHAAGTAENAARAHTLGYDAYCSLQAASATMQEFVRVLAESAGRMSGQNPESSETVAERDQRFSEATEKYAAEKASLLRDHNADIDRVASLAGAALKGPSLRTFQKTIERRDSVQQRVLDALAELAARGVEQPERVQVAFLAGYGNLNSKGFTNAIGTARTAKLIDYPAAGRIALTATGKKKAKAPAKPSTTAELQERVLSLLGGSHERVLRPLIEKYPKPLARDALATAAGYTNVNSKGFTNAIGRLRSLGFIDYPTTGQVAAQPVLFLQ